MAPKRVSKYKIVQHFISLPEEQRVRILRNNLSPLIVETEAGNAFHPFIYGLREKPEKESRAILKKLYGDTEKHLKDTIAHGNELIYLHSDLLGARTDMDKLYAQVCSETLINRLRIFYDDLYDKDKEPYIRKALSGYNSHNKVYPLLDNPINFAEGKSADSFFEDVKKTMDLSKENSMMEDLRAAVPADDPERKEKLQCLAQQYMIFSESRMDPNEFSGKLQGKNWQKNFDTRKIMGDEDVYGRISTEKILKRIKSTMNEIPETEDEKALFKEAALQTCKDYIALKEISKDPDKPEEKELIEFTRGLQKELTAESLKKKDVRDLRESLAGEYAALDKIKIGYFLSKTNSPEHKTMMKGLRLFNAKLDYLGGKEPQGLEPGELETVKNTDVDVLYNNARKGCYDYGCLKTGNGAKGFVHEAGTKRFDSSMKTLSELDELGKKLHLTSPASAVRDSVQLQLLQNRKDKNWLKANIEDLTAKTICAQVLQNKGISDYQQHGLLQTEVENIKSSKAFKQMMKTVDQNKLADALIKGGSALAEVYGKSANAAKEAEKAQKTVKTENKVRDAGEIDPKLLAPKKNDPGLISPVR